MTEKKFHVTADEAAALLRLSLRFEPLMNDPAALLAEMRRQGQKPHVREDEELSFLLGMLLGYVQRTMESRN